MLDLNLLYSLIPTYVSSSPGSLSIIFRKCGQVVNVSHLVGHAGGLCFWLWQWDPLGGVRLSTQSCAMLSSLGILLLGVACNDFNKFCDDLAVASTGAMWFKGTLRLERYYFLKVSGNVNRLTCTKYVCWCLICSLFHLSFLPDIDECENNPCMNVEHMECNNSPGSYFCECVEGYISDGEKCVDKSVCKYDCVRWESCVEYSVESHLVRDWWAHTE